MPSAARSILRAGTAFAGNGSCNGERKEDAGFRFISRDRCFAQFALSRRLSLKFCLQYAAIRRTKVKMPVESAKHTQEELVKALIAKEAMALQKADIA